MKGKRIGSLVIFFIYTYFIANSMLFTLGIIYFDRFSPTYCWEQFKFIFCQWNITGVIFLSPWYPCLLYPILVFAYEAAVLFSPVLLWCRKRSVFHAWLVAMAGLLLPNYLYIFFYKDMEYEVVLPALLVMTAGYALAWLISFCYKKFWKRPLPDKPRQG